MWLRLVQRPSALIDGVDAWHLRLVRRRRQSEVGITTSLSEDLHLVVDAAEPATRRIRKRPVAVNKCVTRSAGFLISREAAVLVNQHVAKTRQHLPRVFRSVRLVYAVVHVNLDLAKAFTLHAGKQLEKRVIILLGRIEVRMTKRRAVMIANGIAKLSSLFPPSLDTPDSLFAKSRLVMVCHHHDYVRLRPRPRDPSCDLFHSP